MNQYNKRFFNEDRKMDYLNEGCKYDEITKPVIAIWFDKASVIETVTVNLDGTKGKDLCEFNLPEIKNMYISLNLRARSTLNTISTFFADYYNWCISQGYIDNSNIQNYYSSPEIKNIIAEVVPVELVEDKFFSKNDIYDFLPMITDETDQFALYASFSGVFGNEYEDLRMFKMSDIDEQNKKVNLYSGKVISVDDTFIKLAKIANEQKYYHPDGVIRQNLMNTYDESYYIFKTCRKKTPNLPVNKQVISKRFDNIKNQVGNRFIACQNVYFNGLVDYIRTQLLLNENVTLKTGLLKKDMSGNYYYSKKIDQYIEEFGSNVQSRSLRQDLKDFIRLFD